MSWFKRAPRPKNPPSTPLPIKTSPIRDKIHEDFKKTGPEKN